MKTLAVNIPNREYNILIGNEILNKSGEFIAEHYKAKQLAVVTDENVWEIHGAELLKSLENSNFSVNPIIMPAGEASKSMASLNYVYNEFAKMHLSRSGLAVAFGGGVIGDLCGYACATYMRGISYVQIPTTLLAQVDSSVGGKTAINLDCGKNLAGAFHQPKLVIIDTALLKTLKDCDYRGGMAEIIKYGVLGSEELFYKLESVRDGLRICEAEIANVIYACCDSKRAIVENDEFDNGQRMLLNLGHTFAHGIETIFNYEKYTHGEAVAIGMCMALKTGEILNFNTKQSTLKLEKLLTDYGLDIKCTIDAKELLESMLLDKKNSESNVKLILIKEIGDSFIYNINVENLAGIIDTVVNSWKI